LPATRDAVPAFVVAVSAVLRRYIEDRFGVRAPESTTEEFLEAVMAPGSELGSHREVLGRFLQLCDLVKFAHLRPEPSAALPLLDTAEGFVESTRA
jgi:hypothetical protein